MEQAVFSVTGGVCRCGFDDPGIEYAFPPSEETGPYVHISFSHPAVLFESAYETSPHVTMPRRSTRVRLVVEAYGGPNGCVLNLSEINMSKLVQIWGPNFQGPLSRQLAIGESYFMTCLFEGVEESFISNDVVVSGQIVDDATATELSSSDELTVFRLEITPQHLAPSNTCPHRHELGCFELVNCQHFPRLTNFNWELVGGTTNLNSRDGGVEMSSANAVLRCPMTNSTARLSATFQDVRYYPQICFVEPRDIVAEKVDYRFPESRNPGDTGAVALKMWLYVHPKTVNFEELSFVEVPWSQGGFASGFFARPDQQRNRYHDENHGAGQWHEIGPGNYWGVDFVGSRAITNWCSGTLVWDIPIGWHGKNDSPTTPVVKIIGTPTTFQRRVEISETGTYSVEKFGHRLSREAVLPTEPDNKNVILDGQERDLQEDLKRFLKEVDTEEQIWIF